MHSHTDNEAQITKKTSSSVRVQEEFHADIKSFARADEKERGQRYLVVSEQIKSVICHMRAN